MTLPASLWFDGTPVEVGQIVEWPPELRGGRVVSVSGSLVGATMSDPYRPGRTYTAYYSNGANRMRRLPERAETMLPPASGIVERQWRNSG